MIEVLKQAYQLLLTEPHAPTVCDQLEVIFRQAIAELESQEPYGWVSQHTTKGMYEWQFNKEIAGVYQDTAISILPVYIHPPQLEQNFCSRCGKRTNDIHTCTPPQGIYYTPPQRTWVGLEWNDMVDVLNEANGKSMELWEMFKALEAKIKERNT